MNHTRVGMGLAAWFLGIIVPVYHHIALHAALVNERSSNRINDMDTVFRYLPWIDWMYLALMILVGALLISSGMFGWPAGGHPPRWNSVTPRGFEVLPAEERVDR